VRGIIVGVFFLQIYYSAGVITEIDTILPLSVFSENEYMIVNIE